MHTHTHWLHWACMALLGLAIMTYGYGYHQLWYKQSQPNAAVQQHLQSQEASHAATQRDITAIQQEMVALSEQLAAMDVRLKHWKTELKEAAELTIAPPGAVLSAAQATSAKPVQAEAPTATTEALEAAQQEIAALQTQIRQISDAQQALSNNQRTLKQAIEQANSTATSSLVSREEKQASIPYLLQQLKEDIAADRPIGAVTSLLLPLLDRDAQISLQQALQHEVSTCENIATQLAEAGKAYEASLPETAEATPSQTEKLLNMLGTLTPKQDETSLWLERIDMAVERSRECDISQSIALLKDAPEPLQQALQGWHKAASARLARNKELAEITAAIATQYQDAE